MTSAVRLLSAVFGFSLTLSSCVVDVPPPTLLPTGPPVRRIDEVSGEYCYYGPDYNVRAFRRGIEDLTFASRSEQKRTADGVRRSYYFHVSESSARSCRT